MPIYEYTCTRCEKSFEQLIIRRTDEEALSCPGCGSSELKRQMSRPAYSGKSESSSAPACGPVG